MITILCQEIFLWCQRTREEKCLAFNLTFMSFTWFCWFVLSFVVTSCARQTTAARKKCRVTWQWHRCPRSLNALPLKSWELPGNVNISASVSCCIRHTSIVTWEFQLNRLPNVSWIIFDGICVRSNKASINCDVGCLDHLMKYPHYGS